jgi:hypothetical protein
LRPAVRPRAREKSLITMPNPHHLQSRDGEAASASSNFKTQRQHILDLLMAAEGAEVPLAEIMVCAAQYNACIYELRKRGYKIVNRSETCNGVKHSWYRLESSPADLTPRTPAPAPSRKKSARAEVQPTPQPSSPAQTLSLFPEMPAPAASPQRSVWRDSELDGLKNGSVRHG